MLAVADIRKTSRMERLQTMELLWKSISASPENLPSPKWHGEVLAGRSEKVAAGKAKFLGLSAVKARLRRKR